MIPDKAGCAVNSLLPLKHNFICEFHVNTLPAVEGMGLKMCQKTEAQLRAE